MVILVIEDDADLCLAMDDLLTWEGHTVLLAMSGMAAIATAKMFEIDLVLSDIGLPDLNGWSTAKQLRKYVKCPIYLITGWTNLASFSGAHTDAVNGVLTKPVSVDDLRRLIATVQDD